MDNVEKYTFYLGKLVEVTIDRPLGSLHPKFGFAYEVNYGFIPDTIAGDGHEVDVWVLGTDKPLSVCSGLCIAVILRHDDDEHKLVVGPANSNEENIMAQINFVEKHYDTELILYTDKD